MGSELLNEEVPLSSATKSYTEWFYELFPMYLNMGMTYELFWEKDASLTKYYRKAYEAKAEHENYLAWLQGAYVYDAICAVSPVLHAFAKKGAKPLPYHKKPYGFEAEKQSNASAEAGAAAFSAFAAQLNKKFKGGEANGRND